MGTFKKSTLILFMLLLSHTAFCQDWKVTQEQRDTTEFFSEDTLQIITMEERLKCDTPIHQSSKVLNALQSFTLTNGEKSKMTGYRVRIYFDNSKNARNRSQEIEDSFREMHPAIPAYRTYTNPFFKVTVGDFRTKSEAMKFMNSIKGTYSSAFVTKEDIKFPLLFF